MVSISPKTTVILVEGGSWHFVYSIIHIYTYVYTHVWLVCLKPPTWKCSSYYKWICKDSCRISQLMELITMILPICSLNCPRSRYWLFINRSSSATFYPVILKSSDLVCCWSVPIPTISSKISHYMTCPSYLHKIVAFTSAGRLASQTYPHL